MHDLIERKGRLIDVEDYKKSMRTKQVSTDSKEDFRIKSEEVDKIKDTTSIFAKTKKKFNELKINLQDRLDTYRENKETKRIIKEEQQKIKEEQRQILEQQKKDEALIKAQEEAIRKQEEASKAAAEEPIKEKTPKKVRTKKEPAKEESEVEKPLKEEPIKEVATKKVIKKVKPKTVSKSKTDLINLISEQTDLSKNKASKFIASFLNVVQENLVRREDTVLENIGIFTTIEMPAKDAVNPQTKEKIVVPAHHQVRFRFDDDLKEKVAQNYTEPELIEVVEEVAVTEKVNNTINKEVKKQEPVVEEPITEESVIEEPKKEEPKITKPKKKKIAVKSKTKTDLIEIISNETGVSKNKASKFLSSLITTIQESLAERKDVELDEFGVFTTIEIPPKDAVNPQTGEAIVVPAHHQVRFRVDNNLKDKVNE